MSERLVGEVVINANDMSNWRFYSFAVSGCTCLRVVKIGAGHDVSAAYIIYWQEQKKTSKSSNGA